MAHIIVVDPALYVPVLMRELASSGHTSHRPALPDVLGAIADGTWDTLLIDPNAWQSGNANEAATVVKEALLVRLQRPDVSVNLFTSIALDALCRALAVDHVQMKQCYYSKRHNEVPPVASAIRTWIALNPEILVSNVDELSREPSYDSGSPDSFSTFRNAFDTYPVRTNPDVDVVLEVSAFLDEVSVNGVWGYFSNREASGTLRTIDDLHAALVAICAFSMADMVDYCEQLFKSSVAPALRKSPSDMAAVLERYESNYVVQVVSDVWSAEWLVVQCLASSFIQHRRLVP